MPRYLGIDPGQTGAAVIIGTDGRTVLWRRRWEDARHPPLLDILLDAGDVVALEAPYVGFGPRAALTLATWCGELIAQFPLGVQVLRPTATQWRAKVFRGPAMRRKPAKALAIAAATRVLGECTPDEAEAWCLARYAWGWSRAGVAP